MSLYEVTRQGLGGVGEGEETQTIPYTGVAKTLDCQPSHVDTWVSSRSCKGTAVGHHEPTGSEMRLWVQPYFSDEVDIDGRVKYGMVDSIVHMEVLVIVLPPSGTKYLKTYNCISMLKIPT